MARTITTPSASSPAVVLPDVIGLGGAIAGIVGGAAMAVVAAAMAGATGNDIWLEAREIAATFLGASFATGATAVLAGTLIHFLFAAALGAVYGILYRRVFRLSTDFGTPIMAGMIYSMTIWLIAYFVVLPLMGSPLVEMYAPALLFSILSMVW